MCEGNNALITFIKRYNNQQERVYRLLSPTPIDLYSTDMFVFQYRAG